MLNHGIKPEDVTKNGRFNLSLFKTRIIDLTKVGDRISPRTLTRLAISLGAKGTAEEVSKRLRFHFNVADARLRRRRGDGGYVYEKL